MQGQHQTGVPSVVQWKDPEAEVAGIVAAIAGDIEQERREPGEILVLTNWKRLGEQIRASLMRQVWLLIPTL